MRACDFIRRSTQADSTKTDDGKPHAFAALVIEQCIKSEFPAKDARDLKWGPLTCRVRAADSWAPHFVIVTKDRLWCFKSWGEDQPLCALNLEQATQISEGDGSLQLQDVNEKELHIMFQSSQEQQRSILGPPLFSLSPSFVLPLFSSILSFSLCSLFLSLFVTISFPPSFSLCVFLYLSIYLFPS